MYSGRTVRQATAFARESARPPFRGGALLFAQFPGRDWRLRTRKSRSRALHEDRVFGAVDGACAAGAASASAEEPPPAGTSGAAERAGRPRGSSGRYSRPVRNGSRDFARRFQARARWRRRARRQRLREGGRVGSRTPAIDPRPVHAGAQGDGVDDVLSATLLPVHRQGVLQPCADDSLDGIDLQSEPGPRESTRCSPGTLH